ncbi:MAG: hypothetical protein U9O94_08355 [Nanoarchaeota archaeon]|nr:hypothetical protein [Nanoarchaeota archaeon]
MTTSFKEFGFAKQWLRRQGLGITNFDKQLLNTQIPNFSMKKIATEWDISLDSVLEESKEPNIHKLSIAGLNSLGITINGTVVKKEERVSRNQRMRYNFFKIPNNNFVPSYCKFIEKIPENHALFIDEANDRICLKGPYAGRNGEEWYNLKQENTRKTKINTYNELNNFYGSFFNPFHTESKDTKLKVDEIPLMFSLSGDLICIDGSKKSGRDPPVIGIVGNRGGGKTLILHTISDNIYLRGLGNQIHINDRMNTYDTWCLEQNFDPFIFMNNKINQFPARLPTVYLTPHTSTIGKPVMARAGVGFYCYIPFSSFINNYHYWIEGLPNWKLGKGSAPRFKKIVQSMDARTIKTKEQFLKLFYDNLDPKSDAMVLEHIISKIDDIFNQQFLDISNLSDPYWCMYRVAAKKKRFVAAPFLVAMRAKLVPVICTRDLYTKEFYPQFMRWTCESLINYALKRKQETAKEKAHFNDYSRTWVFIDEIDDILMSRKARGYTVAAESLLQIFTQGRNLDMAVVFSTQNYKALHSSIRQNKTHLICTKNTFSEAINQIKNDYGLSNQFVSDLKSLDKLEAIFIPGENDCVMYSPNEEDPIPIKSGVYFKGKLIPPMSRHRAS